MSCFSHDAKSLERQRPAPVVARNLFQRQIAADGVELIEIRVHFAHAVGIFFESAE